MGSGPGHSHQKATGKAADSTEHDDPTLEPDLQADSRSRGLAGQDGKQPHLAGLTKVTAPPTGELVVDADFDVSLLPPDLRAQVEVHASVHAALLVSGDQLIATVSVGTDTWAVSLSATEAVTAIVGSEALAEIGAAADFIRQLPARAKKIGGRVRIPLWGQAPNDSFVVLDLARVVRGMSQPGFAAFRPVEAQILTDKNARAGVRMFGDDQVKAGVAVPGEPMGGWFELPDDPRLRSALGTGTDDKAPAAGSSLVGGAFYQDGVLRLAVKPSPEATNGVVAHIDVAFLLEKIEALGGKAAQWAKDALARLKNGALDILKMIGGKLHFELPEGHGTWFDFDLKLQLPHLFGGGGSFNWSKLLPSSFHIDLGGLSFGAMPKLKFPWLHMPKLGGVHVPWDKLGKLLPNMPSLPKLPDFELDLHFGGGLKLGFGGDLSLAFPDLGDLAIGFDLDLEVLLEAAAKISAAGKKLLAKLKAAGDFARRWIHLGSDGVLRIYDQTRPDGMMLGFHLMRLLDGVDPTDLAPTEIRYDEPGGDASIEMGEKSEGDEKRDGKGAPHRPTGTLVVERQNIKPQLPSLYQTLALKEGAPLDVAVYMQGDKLTLWSEADSTVYEHGQAVSMSVSMTAIAGAIRKHLPAGKAPSGKLDVHVDTQNSTLGPRFVFGDVAVGGKAGKLSGHAMWSLEQLAGATDWTAAVPTELELNVDGVGGVEIGKIHPHNPLLGGQRFEVAAPRLRHAVMHDDEENVWAGVHTGDGLLEVSVTKDENSDEGALGRIEIVKLLHQLEKLGAAGKALLERMADFALPTWRTGGSKGDIFAKLADLARAIGDKFLKLVNGILQFRLPDGGFVQWDLNLQLPSLGDLDLSRLIPEFDIKLPSFDFSIALLPTSGFGIPDFHIPLPNLGALADKLPNIHLPKLPHLDISLSDIDLGLSINLGDLFGDGDRSFGFHLPIDALQRLLAKFGHGLEKIWDKGKKLSQLVHPGHDGVVRFFDAEKPHGPRVGIDVKQFILSGGSLESLVPVEMHAEIDDKSGKAIADFDLGDREHTSEKDQAEARPGGKTDGKVFVPRPKTGEIADATIAAPEWLRSHLGADDKAKVRASLYLVGDTAIAYAYLDGSDRGIEITLHTAQLSGLVEAAGKVNLGSAAVSLDKKMSIERGMLVVKFPHGHAAWKVDQLLSAENIADVMPVELVVGNKQGSIDVSEELNLAGLQHRTDVSLAGWEWAENKFPELAAKNLKVEVWTNEFADGSPARIALVAPGAGKKRAGAELDLTAEFVHGLHTKLHDLAVKTSDTVKKALSRTKHVERLGTEGIHLVPSPFGIQVSRGKSGQPDYMYATFGWQHLQKFANGDFSDIAPDDFRVATRSLSLEVSELDTPTGTSVPATARQVAKLHPLLKDSLTAFGIHEEQYVDLDHAESKVVDAENHILQGIGHVYDVDEHQQVTGGKKVQLGVSLEALIAQVLPHRRKWTKPSKKPEELSPGQTSVSGHVGLSEDWQAVEMGVALRHKTRKGNERDFTLQVGWSLDQVIDLLMHLDSVITGDGSPNFSGAGGYLVPDRIDGSFATDKFELAFGNHGHASKYNTSVGDVPGLSTVLGTVLDRATVDAAELHLNLPEGKDFASSIKKAITAGSFIELAGCALKVPRRDPKQPDAPPADHFYEVKFSVTPQVFRRLLYLIPYAGEALKLYDSIKGVIEDPIGTAQSLAYTPEALVQLVEDLPEGWGKLKEKGFKGVVMAIFTGGDPSTKQIVMANRIRKKLEAAGWKKKGDKIPNIEDVPVEYLQWVASLDSKTLVEMQGLAEDLEKRGIEMPDDYKIPPGGNVSVADVRRRMDEVQAGYDQFEKDMKAAETDPVAKADLDKKAEALRKQVDSLLKAGAKPSQVVDQKQGTDKAPTTQEHEYTNVADLPDASEKHEKQARDMFGSEEKDGDVIVSPQEVDYIVKKYAGLSNDQLGELLTTKSTAVDNNGSKIPLLMPEEERPYVRKLFIARMKEAGVEPAAGANIDDAALVASFHVSTDRAERAAAQKAAKESGAAKGKGKAKGATKGEGGSKGAGAGKGEHEEEDDDGGLGSLDDAFEDAPDADQAGAGGKDQGTEAVDGGAKAKAKDKANGGADRIGGSAQAKDKGKADDKAGDDPERDWSLAEALHISGQDIHKFVEVANGTVAFTELGRSLNGRQIQFNDKPLLIEKVELLNIATHGMGADAIYSFMLVMQTDHGNVVQEYAMKGGKFSELNHNVDGKALVEGLSHSIAKNGDAWVVTSTAPFKVEPYTLSIVEVVKADGGQIDLTIRFTEIRTPNGAAVVHTTSGVKIATVGEMVTIRMPEPAATVAHK